MELQRSSPRLSTGSWPSELGTSATAPTDVPCAASVGRLRSAVLAMLLIIAILIMGELYARGLESRYVHALAPHLIDQKQQGSALQAEAFRQPDLLPLYGSSELVVFPELESYQGPYSPIEFFRSYPTGFNVFPVGKEGTSCLIILQRLASVGPDLKGKKVALSLVPDFFIWGGSLEPDTYAANFSRLHAAKLAFSSELSFSVKREAAGRLLEFPETLERDPLLMLGLELVADGSWPSQAAYASLLPLGKLYNLVLSLEDHWETLALIGEQPGPEAGAPRQESPLDWSTLLVLAEQISRQRADNNPLGFDNQAWARLSERIVGRKGSSSDSGFIDDLEQSPGWADLDLLLRGMKDLGAEPLILSAPLNGAYFDFVGVSPQARRTYYRKLREIIRPYGFSLLDFAEHERDLYFVADHGSHVSQKGWIYYDQALDAFYHSAGQSE